MLRRYLRADFLKMKNLPVLWAHIWIPVAINALFLSYYAFTGWSASAKIIGFFESVGAGFPILIGIFAADVAEHEQNAGRFQNLLSQPRKTTAFWLKVILLLLLGLFSVVLTAVIFGAGFRVIANNCDIGVVTCLTAALMMWCKTCLPIMQKPILQDCLLMIRRRKNTPVFIFSYIGQILVICTK